MNLMFTFENPLPNRLADAEVFLATARALAKRFGGGKIFVPSNHPHVHKDGLLEFRFCAAPMDPAFLRHLFMALTMPLRRTFWRCDAIYTRNLLVVGVALLFGRRVIFDHYRPWGDQLPPLQPLLRRLMNRRRFVAAICHSTLTEASYKRIGIAPHKLVTVRTGYDPDLFSGLASPNDLKRDLAMSTDRATVVYAGRVNHKKGLDIVLAAAAQTPELDYVLVGAEGRSYIEAQAAKLSNVRLVAFQPQEQMARYLQAADILLIPPATSPLQVYGSTVLPLKTFLYLGAGKPIVAGDTADNREVLEHLRNAYLVQPDMPEQLADALREIAASRELQTHLAQGAGQTATTFTWSARAERIALALAERRPERQGTSTANWRSETAHWLRHVLKSRYWAMQRTYP